MVTAILILHILVCILLILAVMIQGGENVDITAAFGGVVRLPSARAERCPRWRR